MNYTKAFEEIVKSGQYIGTGCPNSKILLVGKEVATDTKSEKSIEKQNTLSSEKNAKDWKVNIDNGISQSDVKTWVSQEASNSENIDNNPLFAFKGTNRRNTSKTWKKYQKLYDVIFKGGINRDTSLKLDFQKDFFITEMSEVPNKKTGDAIKNPDFKSKLEKRKNNFFNKPFVQEFPIVILACSNYIVNRGKRLEINSIFGVEFVEEKGTAKQKFWIHREKEGQPKKLVIHTRQLSMNVEDELIEKIGAEVKAFLELLRIN